MTTPRINPNDPKWTAYVLGELDEADRAAVERLLEQSAEARALVDDLKSASTVLDEALASETALHLSAAQRAAVRREADAHSPRWSSGVAMRWALSLGTAAVAAAIAIALWPAPALAPVAVQQSIEFSTDPPPPPPGTPETTPVPPPVPPATAAVPPVTTSSTLTGTVRDSAGGVMPGVTITATNQAGGELRQTVTDASGRYRLEGFASEQPYRLSATLPGFQPESADVRATDRVVERDLTMSVGPNLETIVVTAPGDPADLQSARQELAQGVAGRGGAGGRAANVAGGIPGGVVGGVVGGLPEAPLAAPPPAAPRAMAAPAPPVFRAGTPSDAIMARPTGTESYARVGENPFVRVAQEPLATFSIDVDTASYSNVRRFLTQRQLPPADAVRIEELVNYFSYDYPRPSGPHPIGASMQVTEAPWNPRHRLVRIGVKAREIGTVRPASNLVFLIDVSGSMNTPQKLPLVKSGLKMLVDQLGENDTISIVVYASASGLVLPPTSGTRKDVIVRAIDDLQAGGSTNGGAGIQLAYNQATANFIRGGVNRVILVTDGDFNVGITNQGDLTRLIEDRARSGVFLSVLGFGMGNLKDSTLERLADTGNGHYAYIDTLSEARKVLVEEIGSTLVTVAKDVKIQVDFNPGRVEAYRLIGYENRALRPEDFNNDLKDAGDMGAGHAVTALFEIVPRGSTVPGPSIDPSVFQPAAPRDTPPPAAASADLLVLRVRYKQPDAADSTRLDVPLADRGARFSNADADFRFAASVAAFGMILKGSAYQGTATLGWVLDTATASMGPDRSGYRREFLSLVQTASALRDAR